MDEALVFIVFINIVFAGVISSKKTEWVYKITVWFFWTIIVIGLAIALNQGAFGNPHKNIGLPVWFWIGAIFAPFVVGPVLGKMIDSTFQGQSDKGE